MGNQVDLWFQWRRREDVMVHCIIRLCGSDGFLLDSRAKIAGKIRFIDRVEWLRAVGDTAYTQITEAGTEEIDVTLG